WRLHGTRGGVVAGSFFVIPSIFVLLFLSWLVAAYGQVPAVAGLLYGIQAAVIAIVVEAVIRIGRRALKHPVLIGLAAAAFVALYFFGAPFPLVVIGAGVFGAVASSRWPAVFRPAAHGNAIPSAMDAVETVQPSWSRTLRITALFVLLWAIPAGLIVTWRGGDDILTQELRLFTQAAFVTFGGAYAVLSYIAQVAVNAGWLDSTQMVQGLGLAESTPGPLIMVTEYVGFLAAWKLHDGFAPLLYGTLGALITVYATFLPCFYFIFVGAPYVEALAGQRRIQASLAAVTAAVVGVILNLAVFFAGHVLFPNGRFDLFALLIAIGAYLALWRLHTPVYVLIPVAAVIGLVWTLARPLLPLA
ncbi:MAG: chromate transporter, partial [Chloroflexota bacterium]|nr:chromate transporter [Chloroflexota bacterium]